MAHTATLVIVLASVMGLGAAGCGGEGEDGSGQGGASSELSALESGVIDGKVRLRIHAQGSAGAGGTQIRFSGRFENGAESRLPSFDLDVTLHNQGEDPVEFGLLATEDAGYVAFAGLHYKIDDEIYSQLHEANPFLSINPAEWLMRDSQPRTLALDGTEIMYFRGPADGLRLVSDLARAATTLGLDAGSLPTEAEAFDQAVIGFYVDPEDHTLRGLAFRSSSHGASDDLGRFETTAGFTVDIEQANEEQAITPPSEAEPLSALVEQLPFELAGLGEFLSQTR